jgi:hypothetical protein
MADGSDAAMIVGESTYLAALFGHVFAPDDGHVLGYVWCSKHGWVRSDETRVCDDCWIEVMEAQTEDEPELTVDQYCRAADLYEQCGMDWDQAVAIALA